MPSLNELEAASKLMKASYAAQAQAITARTKPEKQAAERAIQNVQERNLDG